MLELVQSYEKHTAPTPSELGTGQENDVDDDDIVRMSPFTGNVNAALRLSTVLLNSVGFLSPADRNGKGEATVTVYNLFWFMFVAGISIITQIGDLIQVCGNLTLMTGTAFLLFTNIAFGTKIINVIMRRDEILDMIKESEIELMFEDRQEGRNIVDRCNRETRRQLILFSFLSGVTVFGWAASAEKNKLPLRAWYPYDAYKSPAYEFTYFYQCAGVIIGATLNVSLDTLVTSLIAVCCCRLKLLALSLETLCQDFNVPSKMILNHAQENIVMKRLRICTIKHQLTLKNASQIQRCFSEPILAQFFVSSVIICVTAYQLGVEIRAGNFIRTISMLAYFLCMMLQVFLYCYHGNQLIEQSAEIANAAYKCPWYICPVYLRKTFLLMIQRSQLVAKLTAGGFATLSLACFASIIKASYTYFTMLQRVEDRVSK